MDFNTYSQWLNNSIVRKLQTSSAGCCYIDYINLSVTDVHQFYLSLKVTKILKYYGVPV